MSVKQLWEGNDSKEWARLLDGRTKLLFLFSYSLLMITIDNPRTLFLLFSTALLGHILIGTSVAKWRILSILVLLNLWGSMFSQALFFAQTPRTPLITLIAADNIFLGTITGGLYIYREGILYGAVQGLRASTMLTLGLAVCWTSDPRQLLRALVYWKLSPQIAFMLVTAVRFLPVLAAETSEVITALQLRSNSKFARKAVLYHLPYIAKPLLARCLRRSQTLALSVVSRGFFLLANNKDNLKWNLQEKIVCIILGIVTISLIAFKIIYLLSEQGLYFGFFRQIYDWTILYL